MRHSRSWSILLGLVVCLAVAPRRLEPSNYLTYVLTLSSDRVSVGGDESRSRITVGDDGYVTAAENGLPALPFRVVNVLLPPGHVLESYRITADDRETLADKVTIESEMPYGLRRNVDSRGAGPPGDASAASSTFWGRYLSTGYLGGHVIASFALFPLRQTRGGGLELAQRIRLDVASSPAAPPGHIAITARRPPHGDPGGPELVSDLVVNPQALRDYVASRPAAARPAEIKPTEYPSLNGGAVDCLIITSDALEGEFQRLAEWKTARGIRTAVRTIRWIEANSRQGADLPETIRFFVRDAYEKWGIGYLILGGDADVVPPRFVRTGTITENVPADLYYACLDGSWNENHDGVWGDVPRDTPDLYPEVFQGRLPVSTTAEAATLVDKIIGYESSSHSYANKVLFAAEVLFPTDWRPGNPAFLNGADIAEGIIDDALAGSPVRTSRLYESASLYTGAVPETRQAVVDSIAAGFNHVCIIGHGFIQSLSVGDASLTIADVDALRNTGRWMNLHVPLGSIAAFEFDCIAERFLVNPAGGAVSVIGPSGTVFIATSGLYMTAYYGALFDQGHIRLGEALAYSRIPRTSIAGSGDNPDLLTHYVQTLLGDPTMQVNTRSLQPLDVAHVSTALQGETRFLIIVSSQGAPVEGATVCLSKDEEDYVVATTDTRGYVMVDFTAETPGEIRVVVTAPNSVMSDTAIEVVPSSTPYVHFSAVSVEDGTSADSSGNGNGIVDAGETVEIGLELKNSGGGAWTGGSVAVRSETPGVTIEDGTATVGPIGPGGTATASDPVRIRFDADLADESRVELELETPASPNGSWHDVFELQVHGPSLRRTTVRIDDDEPLGDGDGVVERGEVFRLLYTIKNHGTGVASGLVAEVESLSDEIRVANGVDSFPDMAPGTASQSVNGFDLVAVCVTGDEQLRLTIRDEYDRVIEDTLTMHAPSRPTALAADRSLHPDRLKLTWTGGGNDVSSYNVYRSPHRGGPYVRANRDLIEHSVFTDTGLQPSSAYAYVVTALSPSGYESAYSEEVFTNTGLAQITGFPAEVPSPSASSPAVGDLDGDGDNEIVVGSERIYAWHHDGTPVVPENVGGVLATVGDNFQASIALANLDDAPGLDIVAADVGTHSVFCLRHDGTVLDGWPQTAEDAIRATPAVGDLDGDKKLEIVAIDINGTVYAWYADGREFRDGDGDSGTKGVFFRTAEISPHYSSPLLCDLDDDEADEIVFGLNAGRIYALNGDGSAVEGWPFTSGAIAGSPVAGDIDHDGLPEVVVRAATFVAYVLDSDGTVAAGWPRSVPIDVPVFGPSPALADVDGDDDIEIILFGRAGNEGSLYIMHHNGDDYAGWPIAVGDVTTESSPIVVDVDGDAVPEVILGTETGIITAYDLTGRVVSGFPINAADAFRATPFAADVDGDDDVDIVTYSWDRAVAVYDMFGTFSAASAPWPTFQANAYRNGCFGYRVVAESEPPLPPLPSLPELSQNFPNPFNPETCIGYSVPEGPSQPVSLIIYDARGTRVRTLVDESVPAGRYEKPWDGLDDGGKPVASGVYFYRLTVGSFAAARKMVRVK